ncbi:hypothetical protein [Algivirga pacifica]|uniref:Short chain amide porin n=1 Tax=Algivirga pacifica TaxID=1162670 RepID=A0ABP9DI46_9BACT
MQSLTLRLGLLFLVQVLFLFPSMGQETKHQQDFPAEYKPLKLSLSEDGSKYLRFILWNQIWAEDNNLSDNINPSLRIRRSRLLAYAQISPRFLVLSHFGLNNLSASNMDPLGSRATNAATANATQIFLHGAWGEFKVSNNEMLYVGAGLHYWNGLSRATNASTLNFVTLDNYRQAWPQLGLTDQFARHLGIYAKGYMGKFRYSVAINDPIHHALGAQDETSLAVGDISYSGKKLLGEASGYAFAGYFEYNLLEKEGHKLPYRVGTYMGKKKVLNLGAGFFNHKNGVVKIEEENTAVGGDVNHFAVDLYYDAPLGKGAINSYVVYYNYHYGFDDYTLGTTYGSGSSIYGQVGYLLPFKSTVGRVMPYMAYSVRDYHAFENSGDALQVGLNWFINGHNAKVTLEYKNSLQNYTGARPERVNGLVMQTQIFL